jgi:hypothetical protein
MQTIVPIPTYRLLDFIAKQVQPINFLEYRGICIWAADGRYTEILYIKIVELAKYLGIPFKVRRGDLCLMFCDEPRRLPEKLLEEFITKCMDRYGIPRHDRENILDNKN